MKKVLGFCSLMLVAFVLAGCAGAAAQATATATSPPTDAPTPSATPVPRSATIKTVEGTVEVRRGAQGEFGPATAGDTLLVGDALRTGTDGRALVVLDDGTGLVVAADSSLDLNLLEGTHESPVTQFFLNLGTVFTIGHGELAPDATYEIETPKGVATIRGSMLGVAYSEAGGTQITCMIGHCGAELNGQSVELTGGQKVTVTDAGVSEPAEMNATEKLEWSKAIKTAEDAGVQTSESIESTCSCDGKDMKCTDGVTVAAFPTCIEGPACTCTADGALSCGSETTADSPVCTSGASGCTCAGPNLICADGQTFLNVPACTGGTACVCNGADLICADGAIYPADPSCGPQTGCVCSSGFLVCPNGTFTFNTAQCGQSPLPCVCEGTTFVCTQNGVSQSIPDYPACGGAGGLPGGTPGGNTGGVVDTGTVNCVCQDGTYYCSDGSVTPGGC